LNIGREPSPILMTWLDSSTPSVRAAARHVLRAIADRIQAIAEQPFGSARTSDPDIRMKVEPRYRYKVFYRIVGSDTVQIIHVRHRSRRQWPVERKRAPSLLPDG
jgi:plasmid stabilization system protein ParE